MIFRFSSDIKLICFRKWNRVKGDVIRAEFVQIVLRLFCVVCVYYQSIEMVLLILVHSSYLIGNMNISDWFFVNDGVVDGFCFRFRMFSSFKIPGIRPRSKSFTDPTNDGISENSLFCKPPKPLVGSPKQKNTRKSNDKISFCRYFANQMFMFHY